MQVVETNNLLTLMKQILTQRKGITGLVGAAIGILVASIVVIAVAIPIITSTLDTDANASRGGTGINGTTKNLLGYAPLLLAVVLIIGVVAAMGVTASEQ